MYVCLWFWNVAVTCSWLVKYNVKYSVLTKLPQLFDFFLQCLGFKMFWHGFSSLFITVEALTLWIFLPQLFWSCLYYCAEKLKKLSIGSRLTIFFCLPMNEITGSSHFLHKINQNSVGCQGQFYLMVKVIIVKSNLVPLFLNYMFRKTDASSYYYMTSYGGWSLCKSSVMWNV